MFEVYVKNVTEEEEKKKEEDLLWFEVLIKLHGIDKG